MPHHCKQRILLWFAMCRLYCSAIFVTIVCFFFCSQPPQMVSTHLSSSRKSITLFVYHPVPVLRGWFKNFSHLWVIHSREFLAELSWFKGKYSTPVLSVQLPAYVQPSNISEKPLLEERSVSGRGWASPTAQISLWTLLQSEPHTPKRVNWVTPANLPITYY